MEFTKDNSQVKCEADHIIHIGGRLGSLQGCIWTLLMTAVQNKTLAFAETPQPQSCKNASIHRKQLVASAKRCLHVSVRMYQSFR